jgi:hypothetical protein
MIFSRSIALARLAERARIRLSWTADASYGSPFFGGTAMARCVIGAILACASLAANVPSAQARPANEILREYDAVVYPSFSEGSDPASLARFQKQIEEAAAQQERLALELARAQPDHARVAELMLRRWTLLCTVAHDAKRVLDETVEPMKASASAALRTAASAARARAALCADLPFADRRRLIDASLAAAPADVSIAFCLIELARSHVADPRVQREIADRLERDFARSECVAAEVKRLRTLLDFVGRELDVRCAAPDRGGRPLLLQFESYPGADGFEREAATLRDWRDRFGARGVAVASLPAASNEPAHEELRAKLGQNRTTFTLLLDRDGRLAAFCDEMAPIEAEVERLIARPRTRRAL